MEVREREELAVVLPPLLQVEEQAPGQAGQGVSQWPCYQRGKRIKVAPAMAAEAPKVGAKEAYVVDSAGTVHFGKRETRRVPVARIGRRRYP